MAQSTDLSEILKRLDAISTELQELKLETRAFQVQISEKLDSLNQRFSAIAEQVQTQDTCL